MDSGKNYFTNTYKRDLNGRVMDREMESNKSLLSNKQVCKIWLKNLEEYITIGKKLHFYGLNKSKISWTALEIKFIREKLKSKGWL